MTTEVERLRSLLVAVRDMARRGVDRPDRAAQVVRDIADKLDRAQIAPDE